MTVTLPNFLTAPVAQADGKIVVPVSLTSDWTGVLIDGAVATADSGPLTNLTDVTVRTGTVYGITRSGRAGTILRLRLKYDAALTSVTSPAIVVFGRANGGEWQRLQTMDDAPAEFTTLTMDLTNDVANANGGTSATFKWTIADKKSNSFDVDGCDDFVFRVKTALAGTGTKTNAVVQAKFI